MLFLNKIKEFKLLGGYRIRLVFRDNFAGEIDLSPLFEKPRGPLDEPFSDPAFFQKVFLDHGALSWPNGYDICPDVLRFYCEIGRVCAQEELNATLKPEAKAAAAPMILNDKSNR